MFMQLYLIFSLFFCGNPEFKYKTKFKSNKQKFLIKAKKEQISEEYLGASCVIYMQSNYFVE